MKILLTFAFILVCGLCRGNVIDNLKTDDDVRAFLKDKINLRKDEDVLANDKPSGSDKLAGTKFLKVDLNGDGRTDLLVNGIHLFAVLDDGNGKFAIDLIDGGTFFGRTYILADIDTLSRPAKIIVRELPDYRQENEKIKYDTLVVRYGGFIEFTDKPFVDKIKEISLKTSGCFGSCPIFDLAVGSDGTAVYNAIEYNDRKGKSQCEIDTAALSDLFNLANYVCSRPLKERYKVNWTDDQTADLTLTFDEGTVKTISDYGMIGTFGLERLYDAIFQLRGTQKWEHQ